MQYLTSTRFYGVLLLLVIFTIITLITTASENPASTVEERYQQALDLYYQGEFYQSLDLMATIIRDNPVNDRIQFLI